MKKLLFSILLMIPILLLGQNELFKVVQEMPRFPGCEEMNASLAEKQECSKVQMLQFLYRNMTYPTLARKSEIQGTVVIQFIVTETGDITDAKIVREIGGGCGEEALRVVESMANMTVSDTVVTFDESNYTETMKVTSSDLKWIPGYQRGKAVNVLYTLPVNFKIEDLSNPAEVDSQDAHHKNTADRKPIMRLSENAEDMQHVQIAYVQQPIDPAKVVGGIIPFGKTLHPIKKLTASHNGIDFRAVPGVSVTAAGSGEVIFAGDKDDKYGKHIIVRHDAETVSLYGHLSEILIKEGQDISTGDLIGKVGMSGQATYPHLHFEVRVGQWSVDPLMSIKALESTNDSSKEVVADAIDVVADNKSRPVFIIDDVKYGEGEEKLKSLEPNDIERINVYKGKKALEIYGPEAVNGVVEVFTKSYKKDAADASDKKLKAKEIEEELDEIVVVSIPYEEPTKIEQEGQENGESEHKHISVGGTTNTVSFTLEQNRPNPSNGKTVIGFDLPNNEPAKLLFYNSIGEALYEVDLNNKKGHNEIEMNTQILNSTGVIYYFLIQGNQTATKKMVVSE